MGCGGSSEASGAGKEEEKATVVTLVYSKKPKRVVPEAVSEVIKYCNGSVEQDAFYGDWWRLVCEPLGVGNEKKSMHAKTHTSFQLSVDMTVFEQKIEGPILKQADGTWQSRHLQAAQSFVSECHIPETSLNECKELLKMGHIKWERMILWCRLKKMRGATYMIEADNMRDAAQQALDAGWILLTKTPNYLSWSDLDVLIPPSHDADICRGFTTGHAATGKGALSLVEGVPVIGYGRSFFPAEPAERRLVLERTGEELQHNALFRLMKLHYCLGLKKPDARSLKALTTMESRSGRLEVAISTVGLIRLALILWNCKSNPDLTGETAVPRSICVYEESKYDPIGVNTLRSTFEGEASNFTFEVGNHVSHKGYTCSMILSTGDTQNVAVEGIK